MQVLTDYNSEQIIIASLLKEPKSAYYKCEEFISGSDLFYLEHQIVYNTISQLIDNGLENLSKADIINHIKTHNPKADNKFDFSDIFNNISELSVPTENLPTYCHKVSSLNFGRKLKDALASGIKEIEGISGEEKISEILSLAERPIEYCTESLLYDSEMIEFQSVIKDYVDFLAQTRPTQKGIPTGFPIYDKLIGGGLIKPGVHLIGGRSKSGKSFMGCQIGINVALHDIPILYLDTELTDKIIMDRMIASLSGVDIDIINTGLFQDSEEASRRVSEAIRSLEQMNISYRNISGMGHKEWISTIRRWIVQNVGFNDDGTTKDCLVVLDYIKTMDLSQLGKLSEWQYLGQVITDLHNLCIKYNIPILSFTQLNRDGISNEGQGVISGSDRLIFLCSSFSIIKKKEPEDMTADPPVNLPGEINGSGDRKLIVVASRFGPGSSDGEYINIITDLAKAQIKEGKTNVQNRTSTKKFVNKKKSFDEPISEDNEFEEAPF